MKHSNKKTTQKQAIIGLIANPFVKNVFFIIQFHISNLIYYFEHICDQHFFLQKKLLILFLEKQFIYLKFVESFFDLDGAEYKLKCFRMYLYEEQPDSEETSLPETSTPLKKGLRIAKTPNFTITTEGLNYE
jgi:hypothetical protein